MFQSHKSTSGTNAYHKEPLHSNLGLGIPNFLAFHLSQS